MVTRRAFLAGGALAFLAAASQPVSRRLLLAAGGDGAFVVPGAAEAFTITSAPEGGWVWFASPKAIQNGTDTIIGYIRDGGTGGDVRAAVVDSATRTVTSTTMVYDNFLDDDHEPPSFVVRPDGKIMAALAYHVGEIYVGIGPSVGVIPDQAHLTNITSQVGSLSGGAGYTYASIVYLDDEDRYYIFARYHDTGIHPHVVFTYSDDDGATWAPRTTVADITYHQVVKNGTGRLDLVMSDHPLFGQNDVAGVPVTIQHTYYDGTWHQSDGSAVTLPIANSGEATTVYDGSPATSWLWDIAIDGSGHPVIVFQVQDDPFPTGAWHYGYARWSGSAWVVNANIADAGGSIDPGADPAHGSTTYSGGIALDHEDPTRVLYSTDAGSTDHQVYLATTSNGGASFVVTQLTDDSAHNVRPIWVKDHTDALQGLWLHGTYNDYNDYSQGIKGFGTA
jgi:hypothetical protein